MAVPLGTTEAEITKKSKKSVAKSTTVDDAIPRKSKKDKGKEIELSNAIDQSSDVTSKRKKDKTKRKAEEENSGANEQNENGTLTDGATSEKRKEKKHRKRDGEPEQDEDRTTLDDDNSAESETKSKHRKKRKRGEKDTGEEVISERQSENKKDAKEKRKKKQTDDATQDTVEVHKKKHKRPKHGFSDPNDDESLSDQARKALAYAYTQVDDPSRWKFNKARQNWLLRNVWSEEAVPEKYGELASKYLSGVQGGVRENLLKTCREILAAPVEKPAIDVSPVNTEAATNSAGAKEVTVNFESAAKQSRARTLLAVLTGTEDV